MPFHATEPKAEISIAYWNDPLHVAYGLLLRALVGLAGHHGMHVIGPHDMQIVRIGPS